jgi:hypothetical protein
MFYTSRLLFPLFLTMLAHDQISADLALDAHALYSCGVCDAFRRVNSIVPVLCFSACCNSLAKSINN